MTRKKRLKKFNEKSYNSLFESICRIIKVHKALENLENKIADCDGLQSFADTPNEDIKHSPSANDIQTYINSTVVKKKPQFIDADEYMKFLEATGEGYESD